MCPPPPLSLIPNEKIYGDKRLEGTDSAKIAKIFSMIFFFAKDSLKSTVQFGIRKNVICEQIVCLPAADAFVFSCPDGRLGDLSHCVKD